MSNQPFTFPPPPPTPPHSFQSHSSYSQPQQERHGFSGRGNRGYRSARGQRRGNNRGGPRGGNFGSVHTTPDYGGFPVERNSQPGLQGSRLNTESSYQHANRFLQPNDSSVQLPRYPVNVGHEYGWRPSGFAAYNSASQPFQASLGTPGQQSQPYANGQRSTAFQGFDVPAPDFPHAIQAPRKVMDSSLVANGAAGQPTFMGPPLRMGFDENQHNHGSHPMPRPAASGTISFQDMFSNDHGLPYSQDSPVGSQSSQYQPSNQYSNHRGRGQKRGFREAFGKQRSKHSRPQAAPAVPSFGAPLPLPIKPPVPQDRGRKPRKKKRKHNQLGLTPKAEEHESSEEEEDDADEEFKLAAAVAGSDAGSQLLQFEYRGQTSTLQGSTDIVAWIEERRKRYPTKARAQEAAERKRQQDEAREAVIQSRRENQERQRALAKEKKRLNAESFKKRKTLKEDNEDATTKAKRKVEKLRKRLEKEEKRIAKAEAKVSGLEAGAQAEKCEGPEGNEVKKRKRSDSGNLDITKVRSPEKVKSEDSQYSSVNDTGVRAEALTHGLKGDQRSTHTVRSSDKHEESGNVVHSAPDPLTPTSQPPASDENRELHNGPCEVPINSAGQGARGVSVSASDSSSEILSTDPEELTSSSGSSSSSLDSGEDAPDQVTSKRNGPQRVSPPKREKPKQICKDFLKSGRCKRGDHCWYRHELPERGSHAAGRKEARKPHGRTERVGLHQRLVEQEKEKEDHEVLKAIIHLGESGLLDEGVLEGQA